MRSLRWALAFATVLVTRVSAFDFSGFTDATQDGNGLVWAIGSAQLSGQYVTNGLFSTDGSAWRLITCPGTSDSASAQRLAKLRDGDVLCIWSSNNEKGEAKLLLSRHRTEASRLFSQIDLAPKSADKWDSPVRVLEDSRGHLWVFSGSRLWHVTVDGVAEVAREFAEEHLNWPLDQVVTSVDGISVPPLEQHGIGVAGIEMLVDGAGRLWVFGTGTREEETRTLRYPHLLNGKEWRTLTTIPGLPEGLIASATLRDPEHLWAARSGGGLYEIDLRTFEAKPVAEPQPGAFRFVERLRAHGDAMLVATHARDEKDQNESPRALRRTAALWRHQEGEWQRLAAGFSDDVPLLDNLASVANDTLIPRSGGGLWNLARHGDSAALKDWRHGIRIAETSRIFPLSGDKLLLMDFRGQGEGRFLQIVDRVLSERPSRLEVFRLRVPMIQDSAGALWQIPLDGSDRLRHHDGTTWRDIPLPNEVAAAHVALLAFDSFGCIWLLPDDTTQLAALFDSQQKAWRIFETLELAYQSNLPRRAEFQLYADWLSPRYSEDGRIAFSHPRERLHYFDGEAWSSADNLLTAEKPFRARIYPFFNRRGLLAWNYNSFSGMITQELDANEGWQQGEFEDNPNDPSWKREKKPPLPRGVISDKPSAHVEDRLGSTWLVAQHRLHRALPGVCVPMIEETEANPFVDHRSLDQVFITGDGEVFLLTDQYNRAEYLHLNFEMPPPDTQARVVTEAHTADLILADSVTPPQWFRWRLDKSAWSDPVSDTRITLDGLPSGEHRCEIVALDRWLRTDPTPAVVSINIRHPESERLARLITDLRNADFEKREAAVRMLARYPENALPALRAARATATEEVGWWIDAAIQEAERAKRAAVK